MDSRPADHEQRIERVCVAIDGLSTGDALGERFFYPPAQMLLRWREPPNPPWRHTDDTEMALSIGDILAIHGRIEQDELARAFARRYRLDPMRGYGATAHTILKEIGFGVPWREASRSAFGGQGSMGNGGAMRVAPVGAYFADDFKRAAAEARLSAEVTHGHLEGQAGAVAVAVAAAWAWQQSNGPAPSRDMLPTVLDFTPPSETRAGIERALGVPADTDVLTAASLLGNGSRVIAQDTVPFALWSARRHLHSYEDAIWATISAFGDIDTNCAIVGGIVALATGREGIPATWLQARE